MVFNKVVEALTLIQNHKKLDTWSLYLYAMKSPITKEKYTKRLEKFFDFFQIKGKDVEQKSIEFVIMSIKEGDIWTFNVILKFMQHLLERFQKKEITGSTIQNYLKSIKLFCEIADIQIQWKKISRGLPRPKNYSDDRIPNIDKIKTLLCYPDRRLKGIICTMASSGIRLGAWDYLRWEHIIPIKNDNNEVITAKIIVYAEEEDSYYSFISKEAFGFLSEWMTFREISGEIINDNSWVMRDLWDTQDIQGKGKGLVTKPNKLTSIGIKKLVNRAIWAQGLRKKLEDGKKRHPLSAIHSYRKWFKTKCEIGGMKPINIEKLLSHSIGISNSYYRPTEKDLLDDYIKIVDDHLTIYHNDNKSIRKEIEKLQERETNR